MSKTINSRHSASYIHKRYSKVLKLLNDKKSYKILTLKNKNNKLDIYIWKTGDMKIAVADWLVHLLIKYPEPSVEFLNEFIPKIKYWQYEKKNFENINNQIVLGTDALILFKETKILKPSLINKQFEEFIILDKYKESLLFYTQACQKARINNDKSPEYKNFNITHSDATRIKNKEYYKSFQQSSYNYYL